MNRINLSKVFFIIITTLSFLGFRNRVFADYCTSSDSCTYPRDCPASTPCGGHSSNNFCSFTANSGLCTNKCSGNSCPNHCSCWTGCCRVCSVTDCGGTPTPTPTPGGGGTTPTPTPTPTPIQTFYDGLIWADDSFSDRIFPNIGEEFTGNTSTSCTTTTKLHTGFIIETFYKSATEQDLREWWCHSTNSLTYYRSKYNIEIGDKYGATLKGLPEGYYCHKWYYRDQNGVSSEGDGCTTDEFTMLGTSLWKNIIWKLRPICNPVGGTWSDWSQCENGVQTRTCQGYTCCPEGCTEGVDCTGCGECPVDGFGTSRPCLTVEGNIWSDDSSDGHKDPSDYWKNSILPNCSTTKTHPSFFLTHYNTDRNTPASDNQINDWYCNNFAYYRGFTGSSANIEPEETHTFTLSNWPDGYKPKAWSYENSLNTNESSSDWFAGDFSTDTLPMPSSGWINVNWELAQEKYNLEITIKEIPVEVVVDHSDPTKDCDSLDFNNFELLSGAEVSVYTADMSKLLCSGTSNNSGIFECDIWVNADDLRIIARKDTVDDEPEHFEMKCPGIGPYEFTPDPINTVDGGLETLEIGLQKNYKEGWTSAIDSDIFANDLEVIVPDGPTNNDPADDQTPQGFAKTLINSSGNNENSLGFSFYESGSLDTPDVTSAECVNNKMYETDTSNPCENYGGYAYNLLGLGKEHDSKWLEQFSFKAPVGITPIDSIDGTFDSGSIYSVSPSDFQNYFDENESYSIEGDEGVPVLYVDGDITISDEIKKTSGNGRLLMVVSGNVSIISSVSTPVASFTMSQEPNIQAGIVASGYIEIESIGESITIDNHDDPVMMSAPLISRSNIATSRDLFHDNNAIIPAHSAKAFSKYLYLLTSLEREKSNDMLYYTGVTTFDLDWEYIY